MIVRCIVSWWSYQILWFRSSCRRVFLHYPSATYSTWSWLTQCAYWAMKTKYSHLPSSIRWEDVMVLLGLLIDGRALTASRIYDKVALYECASRWRGTYWRKNGFSKISLYYFMSMTTWSFNGISIVFLNNLYILHS